ncbi:hypothetical protein [Vibrio superstes]|uniref:Dystroglycan-type cadherin-like domain-containing protein n=1 Tax=Vibrio superstes NBRC 103154 TaxID=1219062 RepID=A0A511QL75_9VIBR|nr:hypothetical protein [Vibrio superstes]GEM77766.1 hypothetical protein VSU01S_00110 [Vibrio superstes NBRC 103154]
MKKTKLALAVALSAGLLAGCDFDVGPDSGSDGGGSEGGGSTPTSAVVGPLWNFEDASGASTQAIGLPNVYVFDGTNLKYYDDDATPNVYEIKVTPYTDDAEAGEITFTYYDEAGTGSEVSGTYTVDNGVLTVDTASEGVLIGADDTSNADIKAAVDAANADAGFNNYVQIIDTLDTDTGELRLKLSDIDLDPITSGKLTVDLVYQEDEDSIGDANSKNAYISFYASGTSTINMHGEIALEAGKIKYRDNNKALVEIVGSYEEGEELKIEANWDDGVFNFKVNDVEHSYAPNEIPENAPVEIIAIRLGDNGSTNNYEVLADNLEVYSNDSGSETLVFNDNFDGYAVGTVLNSSPYNNNSSEAVVVGDTPVEPADPVDPVDPPEEGDVTDDFESYTAGTLISDASSDWKTYNILDDEFGTTTAEVSNAKSNGGTQSLFLEDKNTDNKPFATRAFAAESAAGSVSIDAYFPSTNTKSTYINVGVGKNNSDRYFELNQSGTQLKYEAGDSDVKISDIVQDQWYTVTLAWTAEGKFTVSLDGQVIASDIDQASTGLTTTNIPTQLTLYTGDNGSNVNTAYFDNLASDLF